jgi:predicted lipoprotein with Yx(FWY)xxD motif
LVRAKAALFSRYNRWPLYTYIGDSKPGQANGQAQNLNGGLWYVLSPSGRVIKKH